MDFIQGKGKIPDKISNKALYTKYYVYGHQIELSVDFYYMTE
jgi:hypothetical protein